MNLPKLALKLFLTQNSKLSTTACAFLPLLPVVACARIVTLAGQTVYRRFCKLSLESQLRLWHWPLGWKPRWQQLRDYTGQCQSRGIHWGDLSSTPRQGRSSVTRRLLPSWCSEGIPLLIPKKRPCV